VNIPFALGSLEGTVPALYLVLCLFSDFLLHWQIRLAFGPGESLRRIQGVVAGRFFELLQGLPLILGSGLLLGLHLVEGQQSQTLLAFRKGSLGFSLVDFVAVVGTLPLDVLLLEVDVGKLNVSYYLIYRTRGLLPGRERTPLIVTHLTLHQLVLQGTNILVIILNYALLV
jgi:hypothetical protein